MDTSKTIQVVIDKLNKTKCGIEYLNQYSETLDDAIEILKDLQKDLENIRHSPND